MKNKIIEWIIFWLICGLGALGVGMTAVVYVVQSEKIDELERQVNYYEQQVIEYEMIYEWWDDYIDLLDDINQEAIKDGFYYSPDGRKHQYEGDYQYEEYIEQILDDLELLMELQQHYYQENITSHSFDDWVRINYPALYERVLNYY